MDDAPRALAELQRAFARTITTPLRIVGDHGEYELDVAAYDRDAVTAVKEGARGAEAALGVYNEQYWFRLLSVMQEEFPLTVALAGVHAFNDLTIAYLDAHPPDSARLRDLSNRFVPFLRAIPAQPELLDAAALEFAYIESFDAPQRPPLGVLDAHALTTEPLSFQPHVKLVTLNFNVAALRRRQRSGEAITSADLERHVATHVVWRRDGVLHTTELTAPQAALLHRLYGGEPLDAACSAVERSLDAEQLAALLATVELWFARSAQFGWFAAP